MAQSAKVKTPAKKTKAAAKPAANTTKNTPKTVAKGKGAAPKKKAAGS